MSNYEERCPPEQRTLPLPLDRWNDAKEDTLKLLSGTRSALNSAAISAKGMRGTGYTQAIDNIGNSVRTLSELIRNTRAPFAVVDETNAILKREQDDRLRRAGQGTEQSSSGEILRGEQHGIYAPEDWDRLLAGLANKTEHNSTAARLTGQVFRVEVHHADGQDPKLLFNQLQCNVCKNWFTTFEGFHNHKCS